ncbi:hypothetical protein [Photobacterium leiognathi]|uniref:hypothetical protein n=1 Tax=Photobacterium leiognathi TaxID=553611 RepID=UPI0029813C4E|nr:hypothetical protein [Photobacterium leiognathi]
MAIKITTQKDMIVVRRWKYSKERKRSLPTTVYSVTRYKMPSVLPASVILEYNITEEEQETYNAFAENVNEERNKFRIEYTLKGLRGSLLTAREGLVDERIKQELSLSDYELLSDTVNDIKKLITKNKNILKRKEARETKKKAK